MPFGYPVMLELAGRRCVVIGDDAVREHKVEGLLAAGADDVLVVASAPAAQLDELETIDGRRRGTASVARRRPATAPSWSSRRAATPASATRSRARPAAGERW